MTLRYHYARPGSLQQPPPNTPKGDVLNTESVLHIVLNGLSVQLGLGPDRVQVQVQTGSQVHTGCIKPSLVKPLRHDLLSYVTRG